MSQPVIRRSKPIARKSRPARRVRIKRVSAKNGQVRKANAEWAWAVCARADSMCEWRFYGPACRGTLEAHHHYRKGSRPRLRYDLDNGICLCKRHHAWADEVDGRRFAPWWMENLYPERFARLAMKAQRESRLA